MLNSSHPTAQTLAQDRLLHEHPGSRWDLSALNPTGEEREAPGAQWAGDPEAPLGTAQGLPWVAQAERLMSQGRKAAPHARAHRPRRQVAAGLWDPLSAARLEGCTAFPFENRDTIRHFDHFYFCFHASILAALSGELGWGGNTFLSTIFNLLLFIKLSSSFGGLKQTWIESGKTNSFKTRQRLSLANWLLSVLTTRAQVAGGWEQPMGRLEPAGWDNCAPRKHVLAMAHLLATPGPAQVCTLRGRGAAPGAQGAFPVEEVPAGEQQRDHQGQASGAGQVHSPAAASMAGAAPAMPRSTGTPGTAPPTLAQPPGVGPA